VAFYNTLAIALALTITATGVLLKERTAILADTSQELESIGALIAANAQAPLLFEDRSAALDLLNSLNLLEEDIDACIVTIDGKIFAAHPADIDWAYRLNQQRQGSELPGRQSHIVDIVINGDTVGSVCLTAGLSRFYAYMNNFSRTLLVIVALALAVSLYMGRRTLLSILKPLTKLEQGARDIIDKGDYALRVQSCSDDELGKLTDSFNAMLGQIEIRDQALQQSHDDLEHRVVERTRELELEVKIRKKAEESMRTAKVEAERANQAKSEFLANMSHELRTPLHSILSFTQFGLQEVDEANVETLRSHFKTIGSSSETLLTLLNDLLDLAKLESGHMTFDIQACYLCDILDMSISEFQSLAAERNIEIRNDSQDAEREIQLDPMRMMQVLRNLLSNAVKYSPDEGHILIKSSLRDEMMLIEIADNGVGVPKDELEAIFDKFIQSSKTDTGAGGTGLGLAISREIVESHGGRIWAEVNPEGGTCFKVELPAGIDDEDSESCVRDDIAILQ